MSEDPSEPRLRHLLFQLTMLRSEARTANLSGLPHGESDGLPQMRVEEREDPAWWLQWYAEQRNDQGREEVATALQRLLTDLRYSPRRNAPARERGTKEWRAEIAMSSLRVEDICARYDVSKSTVYNYRKEFKV